MSDIRYEFIMSQIKHIRDIKENEKTKISLVFYEGSQRTCVLKVCKNRDLSEVYNALMEVSHPNVAQVCDCVYEDGNTYVLEEYIVGKTLAEILAEEGTFSEKETTQIIMDVCDGLDILHGQELPIIHNDIKSSNIMITEDGTAKLFDFDISRTYKEDSYKNTKLMGTYEYAAPEHYGFGQSDPRTDIYSLGVTMHEMLKGVGLDNEHNTTYKGSLIKVIKKCVEIDRKKRYASASLLKRALKWNRILHSAVLKITLASIIAAVALGVGGYFLHSYIKDAIEAARLEEELVSETETATEGTEIEQETAKESEENISLEKEINAVQWLKGYFCSMEAWDDGTYLWIEHSRYEENQPVQYYLMTSNEGYKVLELKNEFPSTLAYNPYTNKMYVIMHSNQGDKTSIYYIDQKLNIQKVLTIDGYEESEDRLVFFSDGTASYHGVLYNVKSWSILGEGITCGQNTDSTESGIFYSHVIKDKLYEIWSEGTELKGFWKVDENGNRLDEYGIGDMCHVFYKGRYNEVYSDGNMIYFIGSVDGMSYLYGFDGETYIQIECISTGELRYSHLCVTDKSMRFRDYWRNRIFEFSLE